MNDTPNLEYRKTVGFCAFYLKTMFFNKITLKIKKMIQAVLWGLIKKQSQNNGLFVFDNSLGEENKKTGLFFQGVCF